MGSTKPKMIPKKIDTSWYHLSSFSAICITSTFLTQLLTARNKKLLPSNQMLSQANNLYPAYDQAIGSSLSQVRLHTVVKELPVLLNRVYHMVGKVVNYVTHKIHLLNKNGNSL